MQEYENNFSEEPITIGDMAKKLNVTVRTLQYYDKEGLLRPSAKASGGRRFYTKHDIVKLHQILSMKYLGFSLDDIKNRLTTLSTPQDVAQVLELQKLMFWEQMVKALENFQQMDARWKEFEQEHLKFRNSLK